MTADEHPGERPEPLISLALGRPPQDFIRVVQTIFELKQKGDVAEAGALISWLSGSGNVAASAKMAAGIKGEIGSRDALDYLRGVLEIVKAAGYTGLVIVIDEAETILRMRSDSRHKSLNGIRQIVDAGGFVSGSAVGLHRHTRVLRHPAWRRRPPAAARADPLPQAGPVRQPAAGPARAHPLRRRSASVGRAPSARAVPDRGPRRARIAKISIEFVERLVDAVTAGFRGDVGVVPRQFLREFVTQIDLVEETRGLRPDVRVRFHARELSVEEEHVLSGAPLARPDDGGARAGGGRLVSVFARFAPRLQEAIVARLGWSSLRPVQEEAGEAILGGDNAVMLAPDRGRQDRGVDVPDPLADGRERARRRRRALHRAP